MSLIYILNYLESDNMLNDRFVDLHIINNSIVGFYRTSDVRYTNYKNESLSYFSPSQ